MSKVAVITDSTAYLPPEVVDKYQITVIPQVLIWGEETLLDGIDIQPTEFYERLKTADVMPTTSQATVINFKELFEKLVGEGKDVLCVLLSDKLSGRSTPILKLSNSSPMPTLTSSTPRALLCHLVFVP